MLSLRIFALTVNILTVGAWLTEWSGAQYSCLRSLIETGASTYARKEVDLLASLVVSAGCADPFAYLRHLGLPDSLTTPCTHAKLGRRLLRCLGKA